MKKEKQEEKTKLFIGFGGNLDGSYAIRFAQYSLYKSNDPRMAGDIDFIGFDFGKDKLLDHYILHKAFEISIEQSKKIRDFLSEKIAEIEKEPE